MSTELIDVYLCKTVCYIVTRYFCSDILPVLDQWCSGRHACRVKVSLLVDFKHSCPAELTSYLQARYTCESGQLEIFVYLSI